MSENLHQKVRQAEKIDHDTIYELYTGVGEASSSEEAIELLHDNIVKWLKSKDEDTRFYLLMTYIWIISEFEDEIGFKIREKE